MAATPVTDLDAHIDEAIAALELERKVRLLTGAAMFALRGEPAIGLAPMILSDGPTGVRGAEFVGGRIACLLPNATLLAQHWDTAVTEEAGALLADEAAAQRVHVVLGPTINLHRTPLGGRLFEAYGEDPLLTGELAAAYVRGLQEKGIAATPKHFLANESETDRTTADSVVDERTLREVYLLPFEIVVDRADPWAVMASYNLVNGVPATEHAELLDGVLKGEWRYRGLVMSDWFATTSTAASANGGLDLVMPGPGGPWEGRLVAAVRDGRVAESTVDEHVRRLLRLAHRVGALGTQREWPTDLPAPDGLYRRRQLRRLAAGGMTVLVNRNETLPLASSGTVALIGRHAVETVAQGGGSARVRPPHVVSIADGMVAALGADRVSVADGVEVRRHPTAPPPEALRDPEDGRPGMRVTARDAAGAVLGSRHVERAEVLLSPGGWLESAATVELSAEVVLDRPTRMRVGVRGLGEWVFRAGQRRDTANLRGTGALGEGVLVPHAWTADLELRPGDRIIAAVRPGGDHSLLGLVARPAPRPAAEVISAATRAARDADVAVVVVGLTEEQETEGLDKSTLALPGEQDALVAAVAAVAPRTVVVVNAATPVLMPWLDRVDAVLLAGLPGQEAGDAVAAALLGEVEPAGRLVTTFPARDGDGPAWSPVPVGDRVAYAEGTAVGYRGWFREGMPEPLFWFGHGLGYTTWEYGEGDVTVHRDVVRSVAVTLTNTGRRPGREVVQAYLRPADPAEPVRLIGWTAAHLAPGETARVEVPCDIRTQRMWDAEAGGWEPLPAGGAVLIARGLGDVRVTLPLIG
ncbi:beta-glucosidase family protein [Gandjariella thermophila]|uniref:Glycosyl hydrolase n=1 Tax=Gandjariella thermophila TaxID=1931992 RepID=A0A4D4IZP8_9PSEU|nr:glycoside hydrolase family 3 C-terminal domain-containing protein [Gandjariella thermophila]GDY28380.1 glycosyl hydrolase [Gandjariella thermophila]